MSGEFSKDAAIIYDTDNEGSTSAVYSSEEVIGSKDNPHQRRALERGASLAIMDDLDSPDPDFDEDDTLIELLYVREDHPVFNADLIGDWIYETNGEPMDYILAMSVMKGIRKNY